MEENIIVIKYPKKICFNFDLPKDADLNLRREIEFIIKSNEFLVEIIIKNEIEQLLLKYKHRNNIMDTEKSKTNEPHKFVLNLSQRLDLRSSDKHVVLQNLSIYYKWKNIRKQYENNKLKIIAPTWNYEFDLPDGFLTTIPPIYVYINRINNRLVFKIKDGYKLEIQTTEKMKLFGSTKK